MKRIKAIIVLILLFPSLVFGFSPYSNEQLDELEKEFVQLINQSDQVDRSPLANQYLNFLGKKLALAGRMSQPHFFIVKSREINAFAGPGGHIGINTQLILTSANEDELAAVMAHELAHVRLHHLYRLLEHEKQMRIPMIASVLASIALGVINPTLGAGAMAAAMTGMAQDNINYIRANEKEADRIGIDMLAKAGFNPKGMADFFRKMQQSTRYYYTDNIPAILRTHPMDDDRIAEAENRIAQMPKAKAHDQMDYALFKEMIRVHVASNNKEMLDYYPNTCKKYNQDYACRYGQALSLIANNRYALAESVLTQLLQQYPDHLAFQVALADAQIGLKKYEESLKRLQELQQNYPDNYAALMAYGEGLAAANHADRAAAVLLKASRLFPKDLALCRELARAQSNAGMKGYAYFTQSQCLLLEGRRRDAVAQLKTAKAVSGRDTYLQARIGAKIDEIKMMMEP